MPSGASVITGRMVLMPAFSATNRLSLFSRILQRLNLRFPSLFVLFVLLTLADIVIPDVIPLADEIALALLTLMLGLWKDRRNHRRAGFTVGRRGHPLQ